MLRRSRGEQPHFQRFIANIPGGDEDTVELLGAAVLPGVAGVGAPFLLPMRRVVGAARVQDDARRDPRPLPFAQIQLAQGNGEGDFSEPGSIGGTTLARSLGDTAIRDVA